MTDREAIRLVIWDLDETFWRGTLSEGGITEYLPANHDLVIELARRGIMSSICSRNDFAAVKDILAARGLWDYFIFPSIDWSPKPERIRDIIEAVQLRPATVLFIDDNPSNRAAAAAHIPGLQVESEAFIESIRDSALFRGKDDGGLTRLAQYKLMEKRKSDQTAAGSNDDAFLRASGIRVKIDTDIMANLDRAVELVNRTNQLNFTKNRLPGDPAAAAASLAAQANHFDTQSGLIRVQDKYGDYGYCGFYLVKWRRLVHYCFSCRILGFGVETWLYDKLGRPPIDIVGDVLTDLHAGRKVDWINQDASDGIADVAQDGIWRQQGLSIRGACEVVILEHYFRLDTKKLLVENSYGRNHITFRGDSLWNLDNACSERGEEIAAELGKLGFHKRNVLSRFFTNPSGTPHARVLFCGADFRMKTYRHKTMDFRANFYLLDYSDDICKSSDTAILDHVARFETNAAQQEDILQKCRVIRESYECFSEESPDILNDSRAALRRTLARAPAESPFFLITPHEFSRMTHGIMKNPRAVRFNDLVREVAPDFPHVRVVNIGNFVDDESDIIDSVHYTRIVYFRLYKEIVRQLAAVPWVVAVDA